MDFSGSTTDYHSAFSAPSTPICWDNVVDPLNTGTLQVNPGAIITVNSIADLVDESDGLTTLREAINQANADSSRDLIVFDSSLFASPQTITLSLGELDITQNLSIVAPRDTLTGENSVTVSGNQASRVFEIAAEATVTLNGLIIADGRGNLPNGFGGGINNSGSLIIDNSIVRNHQAMYGGGIYNLGTITVNNSTISNNFVSGMGLGGGGGIYNLGTITVNNSTISNNSESGLGGNGGGGIHNAGGVVIVNHSSINDNRSFASGNEGRGGGIYNVGGNITLSNSTLNGNSSGGRGGSGGGIYNNASGKVTLLHTTVSSNRLTSGFADSGGGIFNDGILTVSNSTINDNTSIGGSLSGAGGGIYNNGILTVSNSTIANNASGTGLVRGGGGGIYNNNNGSLTVSNSTISNNRTSSRGGGIYNNGTLTLVFSTVTQNLAANGGGVFNDANGFASARNTIIASNLLSTDGVNPDVAGSFTSFGYNLIGDSTGSSGFGVTGDIVGTSDHPIDPRLASLDFNGGSTQTVALLVDSPAIDVADPTLQETDPITDQRGFPRVINGRADIGAFEFA
ncbi:hypothetical protein F7734_46945 [Scytonema sp. UIC 10036]|uniref:CSLREA domain-containing protein n=1 Tax=Scytonema sp. UIC 10036 TaxID=2304196 RepID=UPI0012DA9D02|nr:CSLREA domain-containing protein [Scytonema sp. UIC 10036]MUG99430.1 hypothetical protein [Scytonema sp. UIC 10036]